MVSDSVPRPPSRREVGGGYFFLAQPAANGCATPQALGSTTTRVEVFCDDPDGFVRRAIDEGADASREPVRDHEAPWGFHRQGGFVDPFGHIWLLGDRSPLRQEWVQREGALLGGARPGEA